MSFGFKGLKSKSLPFGLILDILYPFSI